MRSVLGIILICFQIVIGDDYYWRDWNGTIPSDALRDKDTKLAAARTYSKRYSGFHPIWLNISSGPEVIYGNDTINDITQVLCTQNPKQYSWEWVNASTIRTTNQSGLVKGGYDRYGDVYFAKIFYKGFWYQGELDGKACYFYGISDCYHTVTPENWCKTPDCMVLKYK